MAAPTLKARAHSGPSYTTLLDSTEKRSKLEQRDFYLRYEDSGWAHSAAEAVRHDVASSQGGRRYWLSKADGSLIFSPGGYLARSGVL